MRIETANGPAGDSFNAALDPPAIQNAEIEHTVQGRFHAAGPGRLMRADRGVDPHIDACGDQVPQLHPVIRQVHQFQFFCAPFDFYLALMNFMNEMFAQIFRLVMMVP